ncbi:MAG: hypothetical protein WD904_11310 [Dehalococcoidia bacterium]
MHYYEQPGSDEARITVSSLLLLTIFVSAVAFIVAAAIWQPWDDDAGPEVVPTAGTFDVPVPEEEIPGDAVEVVAPAEAP